MLIIKHLESAKIQGTYFKTSALYFLSFQMFEKQYGTKAPKQGIRTPEIRRREMNICIGACIKTSHRPHLSGTGGAVCRILASACAISCRDNSPRW